MVIDFKAPATALATVVPVARMVVEVVSELATYVKVVIVLILAPA